MDEKKITINVVGGPGSKDHKPNCQCLVCPNCQATEIDDCRKPQAEWKWQIRAFKVDNYSHCRMCDRWFR